MKNQLTHIFAILFVTFLSSCENEKKTKENIPRELKSKYKIYSIGHADMFEKTKTDTTCIIGKNKYTAFKRGFILFNKDTIHLESEMSIEKTFVTENEKNVYIFYTYEEFNSGGSRVICVDKKTLKVNWEHFIGGFNLSKPVIKNDNVYIASLDYLSKISLKTGKVHWKLYGTYKKYKINYVEKIIFKDSLNLYTFEKQFPSKEIDTLYVNDLTGKITNPNNVYNSLLVITYLRKSSRTFYL